MLNKVTLIGKIFDNPKIRQKTDGREMANFTIGTSEGWKDKLTGERKYKNEYHKVVVYGGLVNVVKSYVKKDSILCVEGKLTHRKYTDKNGVERYISEIVLQGGSSNLVLLGSRTEGETKEKEVASSDEEVISSNDEFDEVPF